MDNRIDHNLVARYMKNNQKAESTRTGPAKVKSERYAFQV
jgi:hypothetical protein